MRNDYIYISSLLLHIFCLIHTVDLSRYLYELPFDYEGEAPFSPHTETTSVGNVWRKIFRLTSGPTLGKTGSQTTGAVQFKASASNGTNVT